MRKRKSDSSDLGVLLLDVKQVAELLNIGVSTVWALVKVGRFPEPIRLTTRCSRWRRGIRTTQINQKVISYSDQIDTFVGTFDVFDLEDSPLINILAERFWIVF